MYLEATLHAGNFSHCSKSKLLESYQGVALIRHRKQRLYRSRSSVLGGTGISDQPEWEELIYTSLTTPV